MMRPMAKYYVVSVKTQPFSPLDLSPALWLDASDTSTITASSGAVSQINDRSSNGRNFAMAVAANQPTTGASTLNGLNVLDFAGDYLTSADPASTWTFLHDGTDYIVAAAWKPGTVSNPDAAYALLGDVIVSSASGMRLFFEDRVISGINNSPRQLLYYGVAGQNAVDNAANNTMSPNAWNVFTVLIDPNNGTAADRSRMFVGSGSVIANNTNTAAPSSSAPSLTLDVGAWGNGGSPLTGSLAELVIVSGANATEANRVKLRDYLANKWGITL